MTTTKAPESPGLRIRDCQARQPWTVPYADGVRFAASGDVPHILASHCALHAAKSVGKLAAVFEALDHGAAIDEGDRLDTIVAMSADLVTAALRFANLYGFDLETALDARVREKNGVGYAEQQRSAAASTQALREAAERLCAAVDHASVLGGPRLAELREMTLKHEPIDGEERDQQRCVLAALDAYDALRSALAAETSGRDGGGNG